VNKERREQLERIQRELKSCQDDEIELTRQIIETLKGKRGGITL